MRFAIALMHQIQGKNRRAIVPNTIIPFFAMRGLV